MNILSLTWTKSTQRQMGKKIDDQHKTKEMEILNGIKEMLEIKKPHNRNEESSEGLFIDWTQLGDAYCAIQG